MAEIGASRCVWLEAKHQLCWWHQCEAVRRRLKGNLPTSVYNPHRAKREHGFIDLAFRPYGHANPNDSEGNVPGEVCEQEIQANYSNPNSIKIRIPSMCSTKSAWEAGYDTGGSPLTGSGHTPMHLAGSVQEMGHDVGGLPLGGGPNLLGICVPTHLAKSAQEAVYNAGGPPLTGGGHVPVRSGQTVRVLEPTTHADTSRLTIRIPAPLTNRETCLLREDEPNEETISGRRTFCPIELRTAIVDMMERHFCAHPLIPGYSAPTPEGIKAWAVKQIYEYCVHNDLPNLWAYLWENWYRRGRWEIWARCGNPEEIPRLKTTMFVEGQ